MSGQGSILSNFLQTNDPSLLLNKIVKILNEYNTDSWRILNALKRWWIIKYRYPMFRLHIRKIEEATADMLYNHPDQFVFVVTRYFVYLVQYSHLFKIDPNDLLDSIFEPNTIYMNMESEMMNDNSSKITKYTVIVRSFIPKIFTDPKEDKFAITNLTVDVERREYKISQICYDTNDATKFATAKILYDKTFYLQSDGTLYNPNYILSKELFDDDLDYYRLMISQIMIFLGGLLESSTELFTVQVNPKDKHVL